MPRFSKKEARELLGVNLKKYGLEDDDKKKNKYNAEKIKSDGITFPSIKEQKKYEELKILKRKGIIDDFEIQPEFLLQPGFRDNTGKKHIAIKYIADFLVYYPDGKQIVIDTKGCRTPVYKLKKKMLLYNYPGIDFQEL